MKNILLLIFLSITACKTIRAGYDIQNIKKDDFIINKTTREEVAKKIKQIDTPNNKEVKFNESDMKDVYTKNPNFPSDCVIPKFDCYTSVETKQIWYSWSVNVQNICFIYNKENVLTEIKEHNIDRTSDDKNLSFNFDIFKCPKKKEVK